MITIFLKRLGVRHSSKDDRKTKKKALLQHTFDDVHTTSMPEANSRKGILALDWATVPPGSNGVFYGDGVEFSGCLPDYSFSRSHHLTFADCHEALVASIDKARRILFELKLQVSCLRNGRLVLDGSPRLLDEELVQAVIELGGALCGPKSVTALLHKLLSAHLRQHPGFKKESARLQASLLRLDKTFRTDIIGLLKSALVHKNTNPDYDRLRAVNEQIQASALAACQDWRDSILPICDEITKTPPWKQAEELAERMEGLKDRANRLGWLSWEDQAYAKLIGPELEIFDTPEGPDKAIAYLDDWCKKAETQQGPSNGTTS
ncbi:hypothetical protein EPUS_03399 [Endocarpon pusillum Z07020]|uniref:Uncharacterized protein n=1 Tax=Endocarpon pusillum (strain Z07020 / HMAS-L-300199) TaxID=1263415 RepID=U1HXN8_ENDPU|nr:uncharacterized protein EPUS_03399 [Endocarpon pusillum Z07020]ERF74209.1 hypothetical protein EPUS_03399 [Endocarpon pusillum Z07020]